MSTALFVQLMVALAGLAMGIAIALIIIGSVELYYRRDFRRRHPDWKGWWK